MRDPPDQETIMAFIANTLSNLPVTSGSIFFVHDNDTTAPRAADGNNGQDPKVPLATIDAAVARCTAGTGDIIVVMPGHVETVAAGDITLDVAGVTVLGLGRGDNRPTLTMGAAGSTISITAAGVRVSNLILAPGAAVTAGVTISGAGAEVDNCLFKEHASSEFVSVISVTAVADVLIRDNELYGLDGTAGAVGIRLNGCDRAKVLRNTIMGDFSVGCIENVTDECLSVFIADNVCRNMSTSGTITMDADATGVIQNNSLGFDGTGSAQFVPGNCRNYENYLANADDETGAIFPGTPST